MSTKWTREAVMAECERLEAKFARYQNGEEPLSPADFSIFTDADFGGLDLTGINFPGTVGTVISGANFNGAFLERVQFYCELIGCTFHDAGLYDVQFHDTIWNVGADDLFRGATLARVAFTVYADFYHIDFAVAKSLTDIELDGNFEHCNLATTWEGGYFTGHFYRCKFSGGTFNDTIMCYASYKLCEGVYQLSGMLDREGEHDEPTDNPVAIWHSLVGYKAADGRARFKATYNTMTADEMLALLAPYPQNAPIAAAVTAIRMLIEGN